MTATLFSKGDALRDTFQAWNAERDVLDAQVGDSLAALAAYQSHLDEWQQQLAREREELRAAKEQFERCHNELETARTQFERDRAESQAALDQCAREQNELAAAKSQLDSDWSELRAARDQLERDRAATDKEQFEASAALTVELNAARDKISALTTSLLGRTEELRTLDNRRSEVVTELEVARAREKELAATLEEYKRTAEQEQLLRKEELRHLRELLERRAETNVVEERPALAPEPPTPPRSTSGGAQMNSRENTVLGSIVEQFDKLRQQRASDRQSVGKSR